LSEETFPFAGQYVARQEAIVNDFNCGLGILSLDEETKVTILN
jgi:hypothetical protein